MGDEKEGHYIYDLMKEKLGSPFEVFKKRSNQKKLTLQILRRRLIDTSLFKKKGKVKKILDIGCSNGSTSMKLLRLLDQNKIKYEYTAIEPMRSALDNFRKTIEEKKS